MRSSFVPDNGRGFRGNFFYEKFAQKRFSEFHASEKPLFGAYQAELLSYEGPFGVGYAVAAFERFDAASSGDFGADPYVRLACASIETYLRTGKPLELTDEWQNALPDEMLLQQAGVFVSIHKNGELRGCIGTIVPTTSSIAQEIISKRYFSFYS